MLSRNILENAPSECCSNKGTSGGIIPQTLGYAFCNQSVRWRTGGGGQAGTEGRKPLEQHGEEAAAAGGKASVLVPPQQHPSGSLAFQRPPRP